MLVNCVVQTLFPVFFSGLMRRPRRPLVFCAQVSLKLCKNLPLALFGPRSQGMSSPSPQEREEEESWVCGCAHFVLIVSSNSTFRQLFRNYPVVCNQYWFDMVFFIHRLVAVFASREHLKQQMESSLFESRLSKIKL